MKIIKKVALLCILPLLAFTAVHKHYVSVTKVEYSEKDTALQITSRIFIEDFTTVLQERYNIKADLGAEGESEEANDYIEKYLRAKFAVAINGENTSYTFIGKKYDDDVMICYLEVPNIALDDVSSIQIENEVLTDIFEEQQNIVHFEVGKKKKSFVLLKSDAKGMLNL